MNTTMYDGFKIKNVRIRNRVGLPPMVCFPFGDDSGFVFPKHIEHYKKSAQGGVGLIVQEATCVTKEGRLANTQLGIWDDKHIEGLKKIVDAVHAESCPIFLQIHHAGVISTSDQPLCPSVFTARGKTGKAMTKLEIKTIQEAFVQAAIRAYKAGYDGIELHGCHSYLISQFLNTTINQRDDEYGQDETLFVVEIIREIKKVVPNDFIVGIRLGGFEPSLEDGIRHALILEKAGVDFLDISYGFSGQDQPYVEKGFPFKDIIYAASMIKKQVKVPVFAVNGIRTPEEAKQVLAVTNVDLVHVGKSQLVDYDWVSKSQKGIEPGRCLNCKRCLHYIDPDLCPGRKLLQKI